MIYIKENFHKDYQNSNIVLANNAQKIYYFQKKIIVIIMKGRTCGCLSTHPFFCRPLSSYSNDQILVEKEQEFFGEHLNN